MTRARTIPHSFIFILTLTLTVLLTTSATAQAQDGFERKAMLESITNRVILPAHERLVEAAGGLEGAAKAFAASPTPETLAAAQAAWGEASTAYAGVELFALGPLDIMVLHSQLNKPAINPTLIAKYLESGEVSAETLAAQGSTVKGLTAIEYLLFSPDGDAAVLDAFSDPQRRDYLVALAENIHTTASALYAYWSPEGENYAATFAAADAAGGSTKGSINMLVNETIVVLEEVARFKLAAPLGLDSGGEPDPGKTEAPLSKTSLARIRANLQSVEDAFRGSSTGEDALSLDDYLVFLGAEAQAELVEERLRTALESLDAIGGTLEDAVLTQPEAVTAVYDAVRALLVATSVDAANQLGITVTFSDADGD